MATGVLEPGLPIQAGLHVHAHCLRGMPGGAALLVINTDRDAPHGLTITDATQRYTLDAANLQDGSVRLNGAALSLTEAGDLPPIAGIATAAGEVMFAPATITFLAVPAAANAACRN
jgi:hypothetical protein